MFVFILFIIIVLAAYAVLILYYTMGWKAIPLYDHTNVLAQPAHVKISVIIPARNEAANIGRCIDSLSKQTYSKKNFEIIIVDDQSTDDTWNIINHIHFDELALVCVKSAEPVNDPGTGKAYKKMAIETGIHAASGELIVTTDADCTFNKNWLQAIASFYVDRQAKFIAAPVKIENGNSFLSVFQALDFITLQGITGASVFKKIHSMCNGANLAYEKKAFLEVGGFRGIDHIPSGDDMLLMHKIYKKFPEQVFFLKSKQAIVSTTDEKSWKGFINQRIRWASKADQYDDKRIFWVLLMVYLLNFLLLCLCFAAFLHSFFLWVLLMLLLIKTCIEYPFVRSAANFFNQQGLMVYFPFLQPFHIVYTVVIGWMGKFGNYTWKERQVK